MKKEHQKESLWLPGKHSSVFHKVAPSRHSKNQEVPNKRAYSLLERTETVLFGRWGRAGMIQWGQVGFGGLDNSDWHNKGVKEYI